MKRSRDVKRITDIGSYLNILDAYNANFETFPSNYGSGNSLTLGYCLTEMANRPDYVGFRDMQFGNLRANTSVAPRDPSNLPPIAPCDMTGSYLYSRLDYAFDKQLVVIAARLEMRESGNYGTGADLIIPANYQSVIDAKK